ERYTRLPALLALCTAGPKSVRENRVSGSVRLSASAPAVYSELRRDRARSAKREGWQPDPTSPLKGGRYRDLFTRSEGLHHGKPQPVCDWRKSCTRCTLPP